MPFTGYDLILTDDFGRELSTLNDGVNFTASRSADGFGMFEMTLPTTFDDTLINRENVRDRMVQVWRRPLGLWRVYFIRRFRYETDTQGKDVFRFWGVDAKDLLRRRIVAAYNGSTQASKTDYADDMMKEIVTEALADGVAPVPTEGTRVWANFSVGADTSLGPTLELDFPFKTLATSNSGGVLYSIQKASLVAGTETFFDVLVKGVSPTNITFLFETTTTQPGRDKTTGKNPVIFSQELGNLKNPFLDYNYLDEITYVYGGGQGQGSSRNVQQVAEAARYNASQWNRCEGFADALNQASNNAVREKAREKLYEGRGLISGGGEVVDVEPTRFGVDWDFGDKVLFSYRGQTLPAIIRTTALSVNQDGRESISANLRYMAVV